MNLETNNGCVVDALRTHVVDAIVHCANCHCTMGSGVAKAIREVYPEAYSADLQTVRGDKNKLGTCSIANTNDGIIFNLYGQYDFGYDGKLYASYEAIRSGLTFIKDYFIKNDIKNLGLPYKMASDRAGADWYKIVEIMSEVFDNSDINIKIFKLQ